MRRAEAVVIRQGSPVGVGDPPSKEEAEEEAEAKEDETFCLRRPLLRPFEEDERRRQEYDQDQQ